MSSQTIQITHFSKTYLKIKLLLFPLTRTQIYDMATVISPSEALTIIHGTFIEQNIQISLYTLLVYDLCESKNYLMTPFSITFNIHHSNHIRQRGEYNNRCLARTHVSFIEKTFMGYNIFILSLNTLWYWYYIIDESIA